MEVSYKNAKENLRNFYLSWRFYYDRITPLTRVFMFAFLFFVVGMGISLFRILAWAGGYTLFVGLLGAIVWSYAYKKGAVD